MPFRVRSGRRVPLPAETPHLVEAPARNPDGGEPREVITTHAHRLDYDRGFATNEVVAMYAIRRYRRVKYGTVLISADGI